MPRYIHTCLTSSFLPLLLLPCHSKTDPATARTNPPPHFPDLPIKTSVAPLVYDTTSPQSRNIIDNLDTYYRAQVRAGFNGSVLVGYKGKILYERYYGYSNRERKETLGANDGCQLASVSKTFTGAAVLYLYQRKYLNIDDP